MSRKVDDWYQYSGAVHIHTTESDGTKPLEEVIAIGQRAGLDFMMFADHMTLSNRERGGDGFYGETLVVIGYEHNDPADTHHYLLFGTPGVYPADMTAKEYVAAGAADGALGIMAHPDEIRDRLKEFPPYPWNDWSVEGYTGLEVWNQMSEWMERLTRWNKLPMAFSPRKSMVGPTDRILRKWDELNLTGRYVGIAGVDAHEFQIRLGPFTVPVFPYKVHFRSLRTHILLREPMSDNAPGARDQLYQAFRDCRVFFSNMRWGSADGFSFYAENRNGRATCGEELVVADGARLHATLPQRAIMKVICNGRKVLQAEGTTLDYGVKQPGIYRLECWRGNRGWVFSNHLRLV
jgi:hypothetical protein